MNVRIISVDFQTGVGCGLTALSTGPIQHRMPVNTYENFKKPHASVSLFYPRAVGITGSEANKPASASH